MKTGRGRRLFRKILAFFHISPKASKRTFTSVKPPCYTWSVVTSKDPGTITGAWYDCPPQYSEDEESEISQETHLRAELQSEITQLWKKVWLGLYEIDDGDSICEKRHHYDRLEALYLGAGLPGKLSTAGLDVLRRWFLWISPRNGMAALRLFDHMSITTLQSILEVLKAYESEIANLQQMYAILDEAQLGLPQLLALKEEDVVDVQKRFLAVANPMARRIERYDIRMDVLTMQSFDEAMVSGHDGFRQKGQHVYYKAFPARRR